VTVATRGRPALAPEELEAQGLRRIADLAARILAVMRTDGHEAFPSERVLRGWLTEAGLPFNQNEVGSALSLLEAVGAIDRSEPALGQPRSGKLKGRYRGT
jgi:hypothetical protein